jgi:hypothetical protein
MQTRQQSYGLTTSSSCSSLTSTSSSIQENKRYRKKWSSNEINRLFNEYELKELSISAIAKLHERGEYAILHRLSIEGLINEKWSDVKGWEPRQY